MKSKDPEVFITEAIEAYMGIVQTVYADSLKMAALYGSAATGTYVPSVSDINLLCVVDPASPRRLFDLGERSRKVTRKYRITPHILSLKELETSSDVFPVEYLEIGETMELLHGTDLISSLEIDRKNLRHQVETMVRGEINSLRQLIITSFSRQKLFALELREWAGRQSALFRGVLRLTGREQGISRHDIIEHLAETFDIPQRPLLELEDLREGVKLSRDLQEVVSELLLAYIAVAEKIDGPEYR